MKINVLPVIVFSSALILFSCATSSVSKKEGALEDFVAEFSEINVDTLDEEKVSPVMVEEILWRIESEEVRYPDGMLSGSIKNEWDDEGFEISQETYDGKGRLVSRYTFNNRTPFQVEIIQHSAAGAPVSKSIRTFTDSLVVSEIQMKISGEELSREETEYDSEGNKIRFEVSSASGNSISTEYIYANGSLSEIVVRDTSGQQIKRFGFSYNNVGILEKEEEFDLKDRLVAGIVYTNENGFFVKEVKKNATGGILSSVEYINDTYGNPVETRYFDRKGRLKELKVTVLKSFTRLKPQK
ncbi:MAG TPA: hypothetical protein VJ861_10850 [Treponemataceae bacterium]|nr:hypothetical protein [Treponemataceae bacterium]